MEFSIANLQPKERASFALRALYEAAGCRKYHMGRFEEYGLYQENRSFLSSEQVITFTDLDGRLLALKPDVTLSIAKTAQPAPGETLKYYYHENVYRPSAESHTFKEISQMGLELLGEVKEPEVRQTVCLAARSLEQMGQPWVLEISHMGYLFGLFDALGVPENARPGLLEKLREKNAHELRRARLVDDTLTDIAIQDGKIAALGEISAPSRKTIELNGKVYVSAGWIDSHVHCYPNSPIYHDEPDSVGIATGVTTVIDAGSTGADDVDDFYQLTRKAATEVYALLNISRVGLIAQNELANMANIDAEAVKQAVNRYPNFIVGLKARMSSSVVGENGITPLAHAKAIQQENDDLPLMVHIGNNPPNLDEIADLLSSGDIITHCYNGKPNRILNPAGELRSSITRALQRGVRLDVGHGTASFSFEVARRAIALGILPHTISSDIYCRNRIDGPVRSLALVMSKFLAIGMTLPQVIDCVTVSAAEGLRLSRKGRLEVGFDADLTLFRLEHRPTLLVDAEKESLQADNILVPLAAIRAGKGYLTEQGSAEHAFDF